MKNKNVLIENGVNLEKSLELFGDMETYDEVLKEFLSGIDERLKKLKSYKEIADMSNYAILVHSLKSDMRYFGFEELADELYKHELKSKENNMYFVYDNYDSLIDSIINMINISHKYFGEVDKLIINYDKIEIIDKPTILVVDDSNIILSFVNKIFNDRYNVMSATDGKEALEIISDNSKYNIIAMLLDLNLPNVNGFSVLNYFKQNDLFKNIPVSVITGIDDEEIINYAFTYDIVDVLRKPFNEINVKNVLEKTINSK